MTTYWKNLLIHLGFACVYLVLQCNTMPAAESSPQLMVQWSDIKVRAMTVPPDGRYILSGEGDMGISGPPVSKPGVITFKAEPPEIGEGGSATLTWETVNATSVSISSLGQVTLSGSQTVRPGKSTIYELTAANAAGETTKTVRVRVIPAMIKQVPMKP